jgi:competence protein ComFC
MAAIHPVVLTGAWLSDFALDYHTISSVCIGYDEYGHPIFDTKYTEMGRLLYQLKSKGDESVVHEIMETIGHFVQTSWNPPLSRIVSMPPSTGVLHSQFLSLLMPWESA